MSAAREKALHECSTEAGKYTNGNWQHMQLHSYRTCMMEHGEPEEGIYGPWTCRGRPPPGGCSPRDVVRFRT
jgi:hypothetical protein